MNPSYEILLHQLFDKQIEREIRKPLRKRKRDLESRLEKLAEVLNRLKQSPQPNQTSNKKLAGFPKQGKQNVEYLYTRVAGAGTGKRSGYRLYYALFEEERIVFPLFLTDQRKNIPRQQKNQETQRISIMITVSEDYLAKRSEHFNIWKGSF